MNPTGAFVGTPNNTVDVAEAIESLARGHLVVLVSHDTADNLAMLVLAADHAGPAELQRAVRLGAGWSYLALTDARCEELGLKVVVKPEDGDDGPPLMAPIVARETATKGLTAIERAHTIAVAIDPTKDWRDIRPGGRVLPLRARPGGVLERPRHTEAAVDLASLAGLTPAAVLVEMLDADGLAIQGSDALAFAEREGLSVVTIPQLVAHRRRTRRVVERAAATRVTTRSGGYLAVGYLDASTGAEHMAMVHGTVAGADEVLVYVHVACWEGDVFRGLRCDCRARLERADARIRERQRGVIVHLAHPGGFEHRDRAEDERSSDIAIVAEILADLGPRSVRVLSGDGTEARSLEDHGVTVMSCETLTARARPDGELR